MCCRSMRYCSKACQKQDWPTHKKEAFACQELSAQFMTPGLPDNVNGHYLRGLDDGVPYATLYRRLGTILRREGIITVPDKILTRDEQRALVTVFVTQHPFIRSWKNHFLFPIAFEIYNNIDDVRKIQIAGLKAIALNHEHVGRVDHYDNDFMTLLTLYRWICNCSPMCNILPISRANINLAFDTIDGWKNPMFNTRTINSIEELMYYKSRFY